jgi:TolA-binding protein
MNYVVSVSKGHSEITNDPLYKECLELQKQIEKSQEKIEKLEGTVRKLETQSDRTRKNMAAAKEGPGGATYDKWVGDLDKADTEIRTTHDDLIPAAEKERDALTEKLNEKMTALSASWTDGCCGGKPDCGNKTPALVG